MTIFYFDGDVSVENLGEKIDVKVEGHDDGVGAFAIGEADEGDDEDAENDGHRVGKLLDCL